jgi:broad specificity phosphatase PhoE
VDHIYASPLKRARETAQLVAAHLDLPVHLNDNLKEAPFFFPNQWMKESEK